MAEENTLYLPVAAVESSVRVGSGSSDMSLGVRFKGQWPEDKCLLQLIVNSNFIKAIHDTKKRGGTVWVRFKVDGSDLNGPEIVVRDVLE